MAATGQSPAIGVPRAAEVVPPGHSQMAANLKAAALTASPLSAAAWRATQPGSTGFGSELLKSQLPRFVGVPGMSEAKAENYPKIVEHAQASQFIDYTIGKARDLQGQERDAYLNAQVAKLSDPRDKALAWHQFRIRLRR